MKSGFAGAILCGLVWASAICGAEEANLHDAALKKAKAILTVQNFERVMKFILDRGKTQTYCQMYNDNPYWDFKDFNAYLNPKEQNEVKPEYDCIVFQVEKVGYFDISLDQARKEVLVRMAYSDQKPEELFLAASIYFQKALEEIEQLAKQKSPPPKETKEGQ